MSGFEIELPSSPDPLGDESIVAPPSSAAAPPSTAKTRRVPQSSVSSRFSALPGTSPRKRMFALDVGDEITHQTIYVTVEAGPDGMPITRSGPGGSSVNRRLFGSPTPQASPRRGVRTTTTTIPLRGLTDDEADAMSVPRRRRRSSGRPDTPTTAGPKKRKKGTPTPKASTRKPRKAATPSIDVLQSETPAVLDQPTPKRRGRPPKRKVDDAQPEQDEPNASQTAPRKRGRPTRRQSLDADALDLLATENDDDAEPRSSKTPTQRSPDASQEPISDPAVGDGGAADVEEDEEEDPFLAISSDPPVEHDRPRRRGQSLEISDSAAAQQYGQDPRVSADKGTPPPEEDDYAPMMEYDDRSDEGSQRNEPGSSPAHSQHGPSEGLGDQGPLHGESDDYAPMADYDDRSDVGSQHEEHVPSAAQVLHKRSEEPEYQGPLPGEPHDYAPTVDYHEKSDVESQHSEATPRAARHSSLPSSDFSELVDQGALPGESDDYARRDYDVRRDLEARHSEAAPGSAEHQSSELEDQEALPGEEDDYAPMMDHDDRSDTESGHSEDTPRASRQVEHQISELEGQARFPGDLEGYAPVMEHDEKSDGESRHSGHTAQSGGYSDNTVDPETFTMIGLETMQAFQGNRDVPKSDLPEIGENTSLFINKTLDSLRQEIVASEGDDGEVDLLGTREQTPAEIEAERSAVATAFSRHQGQPSSASANQSAQSLPRNKSRSPERIQSERHVAATSSPWNRARSSQSPLAELDRSRLQGLRRPKTSSAFGASERSQHRLRVSARAGRWQEADDSRLSPDELNDDEDDFSDIPDEVLAAASFTELPNDVLAASENPKEHQPFKGPSEDELGWAVDVVEEVAAEKVYGHMVNSGGSQNIDHYEMTTSTPNRPNHDQADDATTSQHSGSRSVQSMRRSSQGTQQSSPPNPIRLRADSNRLLTPPDETTSSSNHGTPADDQVQDPAGTSATPDDIGSSPPEITTFDERQMSFSRRDSDTPANPPPSIHLQPVHERITYAAAAGFTTQTYGHRPGLSPIVRAGSRLQNILSDPPSPSGRSSVLGSPFKGSVKDSSPLEGPQAEDAAQNSPEIASERPSSQNAPQPAQPAAKSPTKSWAMSLAPLGRIKSMVSHFTSPRVDVSQAPEDPFGPSTFTRERPRPGSAFMNRIRQASREGSVHSTSTSIARATSGDEEERSQGGDSSPRAPESYTKSERTQKSGMFGSGLFRGRSQHVGTSRSYDGTMDEEPRGIFVGRRSEQTQTRETEQQPAESEPYTDETDNEDAEQLPDDVQSPSAEDEQWSDQDVMKVAGAMADDEQSEEEDIWAIEADRTASSPSAQQRANESINPFRKSGLSIDWGTRSTVSAQLGRDAALRKSAGNAPQDQLDNMDEYSLIGLTSGDSVQPSAKKPTPEDQRQPKKIDLSDFFSSSPNFIERERRAKEVLLAEPADQSSAADQLPHIASPQMTGDTQNTTSSSQRPPSSSSRASTKSPPPDAAAARQPSAQVAMSRTSSSLTPERPRRPQHRPEPRPSHNDAALLETWSVPSSRAPSERRHLTDPLSDDRPSSDDDRPSSPDVIERPSTPVEEPAGPSFAAPLLKPLPGRQASPFKSCLRSPLKPKTAGRVVEFTSSTLSPSSAEAQAQAQAQERADYMKQYWALPDTVDPLPNGDQGVPGNKNQSSSLDAYAHTSQLQHNQQQQQQQYQYGQEEAAESPLSQTRWSRKHWVLLDSFLQSYRRDPLAFQDEYCSEFVIMSPEKRKSRSLLGKVVTSQGEEMVLEQWHLDVADAFRDEVGGWREEVLVKRLFALIVGEERRRLGMVPTRR